jgi:hypothetical protein
MSLDRQGARLLALLGAGLSGFCVGFVACAGGIWAFMVTPC